MWLVLSPLHGLPPAVLLPPPQVTGSLLPPNTFLFHVGSVVHVSQSTFISVFWETAQSLSMVSRRAGDVFASPDELH